MFSCERSSLPPRKEKVLHLTRLMGYLALDFSKALGPAHFAVTKARRYMHFVRNVGRLIQGALQEHQEQFKICLYDEGHRQLFFYRIEFDPSMFLVWRNHLLQTALAAVSYMPVQPSFRHETVQTIIALAFLVTASESLIL